MKKCVRLRNIAAFFLLASVAFTGLVSCDAYNFSGPQPEDQQNIYVFPDEMLGTWKEEPYTTDIDFSVPINNNGGDKYILPGVNLSNEDSNFYVITRHHVSFNTSTEERVVKGAWPRLINGKERLYPQPYTGYWNHLQTINYDSLNRPVDTADNYILYGNRIFEKTKDRLLETGYPYYEEEDTIVILKKDTIYIDLGRYAFLRKLTDSLYAFNIKKGYLGESDQNWWMLMLIEITADNKLVQWEPSGKSGELGCMFYDRPGKSDYFYFDCHWRTAEVLQLKTTGYFSKSATLKKVIQ
jgi:hypothetical protein